MFIHHDQLKELQEKMPDIIGKGMGQLHDDITKVNGGKIIRAVFVRPKLYILEIIGYSKDNTEKLIIA